MWAPFMPKQLEFDVDFAFLDPLLRTLKKAMGIRLSATTPRWLQGLPHGARVVIPQEGLLPFEWPATPTDRVFQMCDGDRRPGLWKGILHYDANDRLPIPRPSNSISALFRFL